MEDFSPRAFVFSLSQLENEHFGILALIENQVFLV